MIDPGFSAYPWAQSWLAKKEEHPFSFYHWGLDGPTPPRAIVQIVHGSLDHGRRYWEFAQFLSGQAIVAVASDHRGHGNTAVLSGGLGHAGPSPWSGTVEDLHTLSCKLNEIYPGTPLFLVGHAMGTWLVRDYIQRYPETADGVVLCSPLPPSPSIDASIEALEAHIEASGAEIPAHSMDESIAAYNAPFEPTTSKWAWFSRDEDELQRYEADPQCQFNERADFILDMLRAERSICLPENMDRFSSSLKVLLLGGEANPVIQNGTYIDTLKKQFQCYGVSEVSDILYPETRHQLLHELNRKGIYADISDWVVSHV